jgi:hypothetical protein
LDHVEVAYLPRNVQPEIHSLIVQQSDLVIERLPVMQEQQLVPQFQVFSQSPHLGGGSSVTTPLLNPLPRPMPTRTSMRKGWRTVTWDARDENGDALVFAVYAKGEGESEWKLLKDQLEESFLSFDTTNFPDGVYQIKVTASDSPSNPSEHSHETSRVTERLYIDNTPPTISGVETIMEGSGRVRVRLVVTDTATWLSKADYAVDNGDFRPVFPVDGVFDAESERFDFVISGLRPGEHTIVFRVTDRNGNQASVKKVVTIKVVN